MSEEVLKALANPGNRAILNLLAVEPTYPRKVGDLLGLSETEAARRLKAMERLGLVGGAWASLDGRNVKLYRLVATRVAVDIGPTGLRVTLGDDAAPSGDGKGPAKAVPAAPAMHPLATQVPAVEGFVGREAELAALAGPERVVVVEGMPGIGKTALLATFARRQEQAGKAVFWHSFRGVESLNWLANRLALFLAPLGHRALLEAVERGADVADKRALLLAGLDTPGVVVVLDDVHKVTDDAVRGVLTDASMQVQKSRLVLAGRERPPHHAGRADLRVLTLAGLGDQASMRFAAARGVTLEAALLPRLRDEVGGHPLALHLFLEAARSLKVPPEALLDRKPERELEDWLLAEIHGTLEEDERHLLALASLFRGPFRDEDLAALTHRRLQGAVLRLRRRLLLHVLPEGYALHEVVRNFSRGQVHDAAALHERLAEHYLARGELEARLEAMHHLLEAGRRDRVLALLQEDLDLRDFDLIGAGYQELYMRILELFPRSDVPDDRAWALIEDEKGDILLHRGQAVEALQHYGEAEALFAGLGEAPRLADLAWKRALALRRLGKRSDALHACDEGLAHAPEGGTERARLEALRAELAGRSAKAP